MHYVSVKTEEVTSLDGAEVGFEMLLHFSVHLMHPFDRAVLLRDF